MNFDNVLIKPENLTRGLGSNLLYNVCHFVMGSRVKELCTLHYYCHSLTSCAIMIIDQVTASAARELAAANSSQRQMEAKFTAMLAAARDASLTGVSQAQQIEATSNAAAAAAVASVRELMREQDQRRQTAISGNGVACGIDSGAAVFKAPQVCDGFCSNWHSSFGCNILRFSVYTWWVIYKILLLN